MTSQIRPVLTIFAFLTLVTGVVYPLVITGIGAALFADAASGSLIVRDGRPVGSRLIGQAFTEPQYFWGRPSATGGAPYNALASGGTNQGPLNPALVDAAKGRMEGLRAVDPGNNAPVPVDLVTASASGLDPHISVAAANYQVARVARARGLPVERVRELVTKHSTDRWLGLFGEPTVNVLELNLALDETAVRGPDGATVPGSE
ncbi:potassium-transporting ATPase subunit KdpC [Povalibacter sp.]|uniref:potassium-transporting ATPase subunit KdpC n=1 Tax=Povalibacter sp. TaxID=1962978 RepID=UPI002F412F8C